ncbi:hypothetical protein A5741_05000 [Mycolicibacterium conceptionense]|nr:hypothetical protein A5639_26005 [Mycolicibacterium conceptionense]OMB73414.1 hypothetical protein A5741_05000 [Mycolicibacterium conceptionense]
MTRFSDDDAGYLSWLEDNPDGYVVNIHRSHHVATARVHRARCRTIRGENPAGGGWTGSYVKVCAQQLDELELWAVGQLGQHVQPCGTCRPDSVVAQPTSIKVRQKNATPPLPEVRSEIHVSTADRSLVQGWADDYIHFGRRRAWEENLRSEIRDACDRLDPSAEEVLHAAYFGAKPANADVENLVLYNIDSFSVAGRNGIRFEHGVGVPPAPSGADYAYGYRYALMPRSSTFEYWRQGRTVASFDWTDLGAFATEKQLAQVWLALARSRAEQRVLEHGCAFETPFAVNVIVRPPHGSERVWGGLVKGIFDGVICAFQAHTDTTILPEVAERIAKVLPAEPAEIEKHLQDQSRAVFGGVPQLVKPFGAGVQWAPADHMCVAGELLAAAPADSYWAIKGEIIEVSRVSHA